ncbi:MAG: hypothetical protein CM15mP32_0740 [Flavobacteriaceae bacterium]|nr:MAG: hypothetical protein CM15mP32_0740 [Flavobacteriaceae bacterium]
MKMNQVEIKKLSVELKEFSNDGKTKQEFLTTLNNIPV